MGGLGFVFRCLIDFDIAHSSSMRDAAAACSTERIAGLGNRTPISPPPPTIPHTPITPPVPPFPHTPPIYLSFASAACPVIMTCSDPTGPNAAVFC
jgi:hypothetical protein